MKNDLPHKFKVPSDYFESLEQDILNQVDNKSSKVIAMNNPSWLKFAVGIAASLLLIVGIFFSLNKNHVTAEEQTYANEVIFETFLEEDNGLEEFELNNEPLYAEILPLAEY